MTDTPERANQGPSDSYSGGTGLTLTDQAPLRPALAIDGDQPSADVWREIAGDDWFQRDQRDTIRRGLAGLTWDEAHDRLDEVGVTAVDGIYADHCVALARGINTCETPPQAAGSFRRLVRLTADFGQPASNQHVVSGLYSDAPLADVGKGPLAALRLRPESDPVPTVAVRLGHGFESRRVGQRREICALLTALARVYDVRVVAGGITQRFLAKCHRADLPSVSEHVTDSPRGGRVTELVEQAWLSLDPEGRPVSILRSIADEPSETLSYHALRSEAHVSRSRISQCISDLRDLDLIDTWDGPDGRAADLLEPGRKLVERLDREIGRQQRLDSDCHGGVSETPKARANNRVSPSVTIPPPPAGEDTGPAARSADDPAAASLSTAAGGDEASPERRRRRPDVTPISRSEHAAAVAGAPRGGVGLVDHPIDRRDDAREPGWSYDGDADRLVISIDHVSPLQHWVTTVRALTSTQTWRHVLPPDRLDGDDGDLGGLEPNLPMLLREARNLGWLPDRALSGDGYREQLEAARERLLDLAGSMNEAKDAGDTEKHRTLRSEVLKMAHGLTGTMVHLLDLAGVDVTFEVRLPEFSRNLGGNEKQRTALVRTLSKAAAIQSRFRQFVVQRQLFEQRPEKRDSGILTDGDPTDPLGKLIPSFVLVGPGVSDLEPDLRAALRNPDTLHEDAPEIAVPIPVEDRSNTRSAFAGVVRGMCRTKDLTATRQAISLIRALTGTPYDAAAALHNLGRETKAPGRDLHPDEVRYALSTLPPKRVLPAHPPTVSKVAHALLTATEPLTQTALADRADVSTQSVRSHRATLEALGLVRQANEGGTAFRFALPFRDERGGSEADAHLPWYAVGGSDRDRHTTLTDVLFEVVVELADDSARLGDPDDSIGGLFFDPGGLEADPSQLAVPDALPELKPWLPVIEALVDGDIGHDHDHGHKPTVEPVTTTDPTETATVVLMGSPPKQTQTTVAAGGVAD